MSDNNKRNGKVSGLQAIFQREPEHHKKLDRLLVMVSYISFVSFIILFIFSVVWSVADKPVYHLLNYNDGRVSAEKCVPFSCISTVAGDEKNRLYVYYSSVDAVNIYRSDGSFEASVVLPANSDAVKKYSQLEFLSSRRQNAALQQGNRTIKVVSTDTEVTGKYENNEKITYEKRNSLIKITGDLKTAAILVFLGLFLVTAVISNRIEYGEKRIKKKANIDVVPAKTGGLK